jgi:hypothetical protein
MFVFDFDSVDKSLSLDVCHILYFLVQLLSAVEAAVLEEDPRGILELALVVLGLVEPDRHLK